MDGTDDHYLLYDLERSALENRPAGIGASDRTNAGTPIFPTIGNQSGDNTGIPPQRQHHMGAQGFFWDSDSERYAFVDDYDGQLHLIVGTTNGASRTPHGVTIAKREICSDVKTQSCEVTLVGAEFTADGVVARFHGVGSYSSLRQLIRYSNRQLVPLP